MKLLKTSLRNGWHFFPAILILIFGMFTIHASVSLKKQNEQIDTHMKIMLMQLEQSVGSDVSPMRTRLDILSKTRKGHEDWLYWSVIAIGLSGFVLFILNADKVIKFQKVNEERREALFLLEKRLAAMDATLDGIAIVDSDGKLTYINPALMSLYGFDERSASGYLGRSWLRLFAENAQNDIQSNILPKLKAQELWSGIFPFESRAGKTVQTELTIKRLADQGYVVTLHDITQILEAGKENDEIRDQLYQAQKMEAIGRLAGGIAHDFNNILAAMNGYAEFLIEDLKEGSAQKTFAENIFKAGAQARSLVDQMMAFSRRTHSYHEPMDVNAPLQESLSMLSASLPKSIEVQSDIDLPHSIIEGNTTQIAQLIMNLCVNARDAMDSDKGKLIVEAKAFKPSEGEYTAWLKEALPDPKDAAPVEIENMGTGHHHLYLNTLDRNHEYICIAVEDTGSGISKKVLQKMFEPFFTTKPVEKGTGLGLSTVHGVVIAHRGALKIDSMIGQGTRFEIYLPLTEEQGVQEAHAVFSEDTRIQASVLLVEDQDDVRFMTQTMLERLGCSVITAENGMAGLDCLRENIGDIDLVITDQNMPKMTGLEMIEEACEDFPDMPFILLSGYSKSELEDLMREHKSIKSIVRKPVQKDELGTRIVKTLNGENQKAA